MVKAAKANNRVNHFDIARLLNMGRGYGAGTGGPVLASIGGEGRSCYKRSEEGWREGRGGGRKGRRGEGGEHSLRTRYFALRTWYSVFRRPGVRCTEYEIQRWTSPLPPSA